MVDARFGQAPGRNIVMGANPAAILERLRGHLDNPPVREFDNDIKSAAPGDARALLQLMNDDQSLKAMSSR